MSVSLIVFPSAKVKYELDTDLPIIFVEVQDGNILAAARQKAVQRLSFAADLAIRERCQFIAGDPDFRSLESTGVLQLEWLGA